MHAKCHTAALIKKTLLLLAMGLFATSAQAAPLAYEGFDYTAETLVTPSNLSSQGAAADGWNGPWSGSGNFYVIDDASPWRVNNTITHPSLSYPDVPQTGNRVGMQKRWVTVSRGLDVAGAFADYDDGSGQIGKDGTTLWASWLMMGPTADRAQGIFLVFNGAGDDIGVGSHKNIDFGPELYVFKNSDTSVNDYTNHDFTGNGTFFLVQFIFGTGNNDTVNVYINEDAAGDPNTFVADATLSGFDMSFNSVQLKNTDTDSEVYQWDEIRIGASAQDVLGLAGGLTGDFDGDGDIDGVDIAEMFSNFNGPGGGAPTNPATDLDGDGDVDGVDIGSLFGLFTGPLAPANVPEPTSLALIGLGGLWGLRRPRQDACHTENDSRPLFFPFSSLATTRDREGEIDYRKSSIQSAYITGPLHFEPTYAALLIVRDEVKTLTLTEVSAIDLVYLSVFTEIESLVLFLDIDNVPENMDYLMLLPKLENLMIVSGELSQEHVKTIAEIPSLKLLELISCPAEAIALDLLRSKGIEVIQKE